MRLSWSLRKKKIKKLAYSMYQVPKFFTENWIFMTERDKISHSIETTGSVLGVTDQPGLVTYTCCNNESELHVYKYGTITMMLVWLLNMVKKYAALRVLHSVLSAEKV